MDLVPTLSWMTRARDVDALARYSDDPAMLESYSRDWRSRAGGADSEGWPESAAFYRTLAVAYRMFSELAGADP